MTMHRDVRNVLERALTVKGLMEILECLNPDAHVLFTCDYGDHSHTMQALPVENVKEELTARLKASAYSQSDVALRDEDEDEDEDEEDGRADQDEDTDNAEKVVILS